MSRKVVKNTNGNQGSSNLHRRSLRKPKKHKLDRTITITKGRSWYIDKHGHRRILSDPISFKINARHAGLAGLMTSISMRRFKYSLRGAYNFIRRNLNNPLVIMHHARLEKLAVRINNLSRTGKLKELRTARVKMKKVVARLKMSDITRKLAFIGKQRHQIWLATRGSSALSNLGYSFDKRHRGFMQGIHTELRKDPLKWNLKELNAKLDSMVLKVSNFQQYVVFKKMMQQFLAQAKLLKMLPGYRQAHKKVIKQYKKNGKFKKLQLALQALNCNANADDFAPIEGPLAPNPLSEEDSFPVILARTTTFITKHRPVLEQYAKDLQEASAQTAMGRQKALEGESVAFLKDTHALLADIKSKDPAKRKAALETLTTLIYKTDIDDIDIAITSTVQVPENYVNYDSFAIDNQVMQDTLTAYETLDDDARYEERQELQNRMDDDQAFQEQYRASLIRKHSAMNFIREYVAKAKKIDGKILAIASWLHGVSRSRFTKALRLLKRNDLGKKRYETQQRLLAKVDSAKTPEAFLEHFHKAAFFINAAQMVVGFNKLEAQNNEIAKAKKSTNKVANFFLGCYYATLGIHKSVRAVITNDYSGTPFYGDNDDPLNAAEWIRDGKAKALKALSLFEKGLTKDNMRKFEDLVKGAAHHLKQASGAVDFNNEMLEDIAWVNTAGAIAVTVAAIIVSAVTAGWGSAAVLKLAGGSRVLFALYSTAVASSSFHIAHTGGEMAVFRKTPTLSTFFKGAGRNFALFLVAGQAMRGLNKLMGIEAAAANSAAQAGMRARIGALGKSFGLSKHTVKILSGTVKAGLGAKAAAWSRFVLAMATKGFPKWATHLTGEMGIFMGAEKLIAYAAGEEHQSSSLVEMGLMVLLLRRVNRVMEPHVKKVTLRRLEKSIQSTRAKIKALIDAGKLTDAARLKLSKRGLLLITAYRGVKGKGSQGDFGNEFGRWKKMGESAIRRMSTVEPSTLMLDVFKTAGMGIFTALFERRMRKLSASEKATIKLALRYYNPDNPAMKDINTVSLLRINRILGKYGYTIEGGVIKKLPPKPGAWARTKGALKNAVGEAGGYRLRVNPGLLAAFPGNVELSKKDGTGKGTVRRDSSDLNSGKIAQGKGSTKAKDGTSKGTVRRDSGDLNSSRIAQGKGGTKAKDGTKGKTKAGTQSVSESQVVQSGSRSGSKNSKTPPPVPEDAKPIKIKSKDLYPADGPPPLPLSQTSAHKSFMSHAHALQAGPGRGKVTTITYNKDQGTWITRQASSVNTGKATVTAIVHDAGTARARFTIMTMFRSLFDIATRRKRAEIHPNERDGLKSPKADETWIVAKDDATANALRARLIRETERVRIQEGNNAADAFRGKYKIFTQKEWDAHRKLLDIAHGSMYTKGRPSGLPLNARDANRLATYFMQMNDYMLGIMAGKQPPRPSKKSLPAHLRTHRAVRRLDTHIGKVESRYRYTVKGNPVSLKRDLNYRKLTDSTEIGIINLDGTRGFMRARYNGSNDTLVVTLPKSFKATPRGERRAIDATRRAVHKKFPGKDINVVVVFGNTNPATAGAAKTKVSFSTKTTSGGKKLSGGLVQDQGMVGRITIKGNDVRVEFGQSIGSRAKARVKRNLEAELVRNGANPTQKKVTVVDNTGPMLVRGRDGILRRVDRSVAQPAKGPTPIFGPARPASPPPAKAGARPSIWRRLMPTIRTSGRLGAGFGGVGTSAHWNTAPVTIVSQRNASNPKRFGKSTDVHWDGKGNLVVKGGGADYVVVWNGKSWAPVSGSITVRPGTHIGVNGKGHELKPPFKFDWMPSRSMQNGAHQGHLVGSDGQRGRIFFRYGKGGTPVLQVEGKFSANTQGAITHGLRSNYGPNAQVQWREPSVAFEGSSMRIRGTLGTTTFEGKNASMTIQATNPGGNLNYKITVRGRFTNERAVELAVKSSVMKQSGAPSSDNITVVFVNPPKVKTPKPVVQPAAKPQIKPEERHQVNGNARRGNVHNSVVRGTIHSGGSRAAALNPQQIVKTGKWAQIGDSGVWYRWTNGDWSVRNTTDKPTHYWNNRNELCTLKPGETHTDVINGARFIKNPTLGALLVWVKLK